jgi:hypothetical protein
MCEAILSERTTTYKRHQPMYYNVMSFPQGSYIASCNFVSASILLWDLHQSPPSTISNGIIQVGDPLFPKWWSDEWSIGEGHW